MDITKIDAATRQLQTAIQLYFEDRDAVSVHTLATAAAEIIDRLCAAKGLQSMRAQFMSMIKPEHRKELGDTLNKARNFFKHASTGNPDEVLQPPPREQVLEIYGNIWSQSRSQQKMCGRDMLQLSQNGKSATS